MFQPQQTESSSAIPYVSEQLCPVQGVLVGEQEQKKDRRKEGTKSISDVGMINLI